MTKDPVCGMQVDEKNAAAQTQHMGKTYYFCAPGCKKAFEADPAKYTEAKEHKMGGHGGHKM
jgi:YHS domain-containing protein